MFEYLMPALWMTHHRHTIMQDSMEAVVRIQQSVALEAHSMGYLGVGV